MRDAPRIDPNRLKQFADAYGLAVLKAVAELHPYLQNKSAEDYARDSTIVMLGRIEAAGIEAVADYILNVGGGALSITCETLGIPCTPRSMQDFLEGGK